MASLYPELHPPCGGLARGYYLCHAFGVLQNLEQNNILKMKRDDSLIGNKSTQMTQIKQITMFAALQTPEALNMNNPVQVCRRQTQLGDNENARAISNPVGVEHQQLAMVELLRSSVFSHGLTLPRAASALRRTCTGLLLVSRLRRAAKLRKKKIYSR